jgi:hypothetical protein
MKRFGRKTSIAVIAGAAVAMGGFASGAIPDAGGVIDGCFLTGNGQLRIIDSDADGTCKTNETAVSWNAQGQAGPKGDEGPQGTQGEQGPPGANGATNVVVRTRVVNENPGFLVPVGSAIFTGVGCRPGERATGGGLRFVPDEDGDHISGAWPFDGVNFWEPPTGSTPVGWVGKIYNGGSEPKFAHVYVICASP